MSKTVTWAAMEALEIGITEEVVEHGGRKLRDISLVQLLPVCCCQSCCRSDNVMEARLRHCKREGKELHELNVHRTYISAVPGHVLVLKNISLYAHTKSGTLSNIMQPEASQDDVVIA